MKKFLAVLVAVSIMLLSASVMADDTTKTLTFEWTMEDTTNLKEWKLLWTDTSGGTYDENNPVAVIQYDPNVPGPVYSSPTAATVTGNQATTVTKFFVMIACGDIPQQGKASKYLCSGYSNEVSHDFWIPAGMFSVPVDFKIKASE